jgi:1-deoxy-D-xylulose-5-phosphate reductoisomerase
MPLQESTPELTAPFITAPLRLVVLGCSGSIGVQALQVLASHPQQISVLALSAGHNINQLVQQVAQVKPKWVGVATEEGRQAFYAACPTFAKDKVLIGEEGLCTLATLPEATGVLVGLVGFLGLAPSLAALKAGKTLYTANKETFVAGGHLVQPYLKQVVPFDSEHSALFQCLQGNSLKEVDTLWLTASGGAFRDWPLERLQEVTVAQALKHPNWEMGAKVTVDSATLMNKGLEVIEAYWLFGLPASAIEVVVHPQSMVHSAVAYCDGSVIAQLGPPDMRLPIQYALSHPQRWPAPYAPRPLKLTELNQLEFSAPCLERFPCLRLAYEALALGSLATTTLNAADEIAVALFLEENLSFVEIPKLLSRVLEAFRQSEWAHFKPNEIQSGDLALLKQVDAWARTITTLEAENVEAE